MRQNLDRVLTFMSSILETRAANQLPLECYLEALGAAKRWCKYSNRTFVPNQKFIQLIFQIIENDYQMFSKAVSVLKMLLIESQFVKALENNSEALAFQIIPEVDKTFLQSIIMYCSR